MLYCYSGLQATTFITSNKIKGKFLPSLMTDYLIQSVALLPQAALHCNRCYTAVFTVPQQKSNVNTNVP